MSSFFQFAETAEKVLSTSKRLEKAAFLRDYFKTLTDEDLPLATRFFAGQAFSSADQRRTNIGAAALFNAISATSGVSIEELKAKTVKLGDLGDVAEQVFPVSTTPKYTLQNVKDFIATIAETRGTKAKTEFLTEFLRFASSLEAKYIVKILTGDLRIGLLEGAVEDALARMFDVPVTKVQWTNMLTGDIGETALLLRSGKTDQAQMRFFHPIKFMLATASDVDDVAKRMPEKFIVEDKFDGIRAQAHVALTTEKSSAGTYVENIRVALFSRTLDEITKSFPELVEPLSKLIQSEIDSLILDGEILPIRDGRILPFQDLQKRLGRKTVSAEMLEQTPVAFVAYDCLYGNGQILINENFETRRRVLASLPFDAKYTILTESKIFTKVANIDEEFNAARARGNEGLMIKNPLASYKSGKRGRDWLKIKRALATLDVVVTAVEVGNGRRSRFLSDYTFAVRTSETDSTLLNVGKAYSGLTDAEIEELSNWFRAHTIQEFAHGKVRIVEPKIVLEVTFDRVQSSARHKGGYSLRFPRILRIRTDKLPTEIDTLEIVKKLSK